MTYASASVENFHQVAPNANKVEQKNAVRAEAVSRKAKRNTTHPATALNTAFRTCNTVIAHTGKPHHRPTWNTPYPSAEYSRWFVWNRIAAGSCPRFTPSIYSENNTPSQ